jgi:hypothetical protein
LEAWSGSLRSTVGGGVLETGFRVGKGFRAKNTNTSTSTVLREVHHQYGVVLEEL